MRILVFSVFFFFLALIVSTLGIRETCSYFNFSIKSGLFIIKFILNQSTSIIEPDKKIIGLFIYQVIHF